MTNASCLPVCLPTDCCVLYRLAKMGLSICLSALIQSCATQLDFRHKCNGGETAQMAAESSQHQACADILNQASRFGTATQQSTSQPSSTEAAQAAAHAASVILDPRGMYPQQHPSAPMPGLFPLLANMQGQINAMLHLNMQPAHMYGFNQLPPVLSAPAMAASQRASMESASTSHTRPSLDDASMLSRLYPSSSLESSFSHHRMSIDDPQHRMSSGSRRSSVSAALLLCHAGCRLMLACCMLSVCCHIVEAIRKYAILQ